MAVTYGFYNSLNKDRVYNAEQMSSIFNGIITDGVFASIGGSLMPIAGTGMQVIVKTGKCWFNSTWTLNDALLPLDISAADVSLTRIDAIVVEINSAVNARANTVKVVKGTPSANPAKPTLANTETLHQYALGYVTVSAGVTSITADKIEVNVGKTTCPFITSVLQQTDITTLFNQWDAEFNTWFENVQSQLSGDIAANLQRQIDERVKIADKATEEEAVAGISNEKWITPKTLKAAGDSILKPGDIIYKTDKMSKDGFLRCDGSIISIDDYPRLASVLNNQGNYISIDKNAYPTTYIPAQSALSIDDYGVFWSHNAGDETPGFYINVFDPIAKTITKHLLASYASFNDSDVKYYKVCFFGKVNNQYMALLSYYSGKYHAVYALASSSLLGSYSIIKLNLYEQHTPLRIAYVNSQYMICFLESRTYASDSLSANFTWITNDNPVWIYRGGYFYVVGNSGNRIQIYKRASLDGANLSTVTLFTTTRPTSYDTYPGYPCDLFDLDDDYWYITFFVTNTDNVQSNGNVWVFNNNGDIVSKLSFVNKQYGTSATYICNTFRPLERNEAGMWIFMSRDMGCYISEKTTFNSLDDFKKIDESVAPNFINGEALVVHAQDKFMAINSNANNIDKWYLLDPINNAAILPKMPAIDIAVPYIKF